MRNIKNIKREIESYIKTENLQDYEFIGESTIRKRGEVNIKHLTCNREFSMSKYDFITRKRRCPYCFRNHKKDDNSFKSEVLEKTGSEYTVLGKYINSREKILIKHNTCGNEYLVAPYKFSQGKRCPKCQHGSTKKSIEDFKSEVFNLVGNEYTVLSDNYVTNQTKLSIKHNTCGNIWEISPASFLSGKRCPKCQHRATIYSLDEFNDLIKEVAPEYKCLEYNGRKKPGKFIHLTCNKEFTKVPDSLLNGSGCPFCKTFSQSKQEKELAKFIGSFYKGTIERNKLFSRDETNKKLKYELDIYIPDKNVGIEFDGLYWHSESKVGKNYHINKTNFFKEKGIRVIHIFDDEWKNKQDILKSKIRHILGSSNQERVYARKCSIKEVSSLDRNIFLDKYHIQGADNSGIRVGLYQDTELVSVMTFGKQRISLGTKKTNDDEYELIRFASSKNVIGGFSKLLKYCIKKYSIKYIKTFADLRYSDFNNNVYIKNGFELSHISSPSYWYFKKQELKRYHRFIFRKQEVKRRFSDNFSPELTEYENMKNNGYDRIWDCGNLVFKMDLSKEEVCEHTP